MKRKIINSLLLPDKKALILLIMFIAIVSNNFIGSLIMFVLGLYSYYLLSKRNYQLNDEVKFNGLFLVFLFFLPLSLLATLFGNGISSLFFLFSEFKIILLFFLPSFFIILMQNSKHDIVLEFSKILIILLFFIQIFGFLILNEQRYTGFFGLSIYMSYMLIFILFYYYDVFNTLFKILIFLSLILLGSKMGFILFFLTLVLKQKRGESKVIYLLLLPVFVLLFYFYSLEFRGQDLLIYEDIDRFLLFEATIKYIKSNFDFLNYFFGYGIGNELIGFQTSSPAFNNWFLKSFTQGHVYSYTLHNEFFRLLFDYGIVGLLIILKYLKNNKIPMAILLVAMLTNSILFSNELIFLLSLFIAQYQYEKCSSKFKKVQ